MFDAAPGLPPAVALLLNEDFPLDDRARARRRLRSMVKEVKEQVLSVPLEPASFYPSEEQDPRVFRVFMDGGLDIFSRNGACLSLSCRFEYALQIARSVALMSDGVWFRDYFTERLLALRSRPLNVELDCILDDIYVLHRIRPLVAAGIARFHSPMIPLCSGCGGEFERRVQATADAMLKKFRREMSVEHHGPGVAVVHTGPAYDPALVLRAVSKTGRAFTSTDDDVLWDVIHGAVRGSLWSARDAAVHGGSVFSNSPVGLAGLLSQDGKRVGRRAVCALAGHRAGNLPWVNGLSIEQTIHLRNEAASALPRLREFLARHLSARPTSETRSPTDADAYIYELREQAAEVRAELQAAGAGSPSIGRSLLGLLTLGVSVLGFAVDSPTVGAASGLIGTLGLLHQLNQPDAKHEALIKSKPGYVLVAARDLLAHAATGQR